MGAPWIIKKVVAPPAVVDEPRKARPELKKVKVSKKKERAVPAKKAAAADK